MSPEPSQLSAFDLSRDYLAGIAFEPTELFKQKPSCPLKCIPRDYEVSQCRFESYLSFRISLVRH